ncbi:MAG TPA: hypothetical protein VIC86_03535 [Acidimicrobiales bacterium]
MARDTGRSDPGGPDDPGATGDLGDLGDPADLGDRGDHHPIPVIPVVNRRAWLVSAAAGAPVQSPAVWEPDGSTPLDVDEPEQVVPTSPLWAMKYLRHGRGGPSSDDPGSGRIRWASDDLGASDDVEGDGAEGDGVDADGDAAEGVYVIDDGYDHCMVARTVGASPDGCTYCLVARIKLLDFDDVLAGWAQPAGLFSLGREFTLCAVVDGPVSNVVRVARYRRLKDVPADYLPPSPFIDFDETI